MRVWARALDEIPSTNAITAIQEIARFTISSTIEIRNRLLN